MGRELRMEGRELRIAKAGPWWKLAAGEKGLTERGEDLFQKETKRKGRKRFNRKEHRDRKDLSALNFSRSK